MEFSKFKSFPVQDATDYTDATRHRRFSTLRQDGKVGIPEAFLRLSPFDLKHFTRDREPMPFVAMWGDGTVWLTPKPYWQQVVDQVTPEDREQLALAGVDVICAGTGDVKLPHEALVEMFGEDYAGMQGEALYTVKGDGSTIVMRAYESPGVEQQRKSLGRELGAKVVGKLEQGNVGGAHQLVDAYARSIVPSGALRPHGF
jgi:hypothetical protein